MLGVERVCSTDCSTIGRMKGRTSTLSYGKRPLIVRASTTVTMIAMVVRSRDVDVVVDLDSRMSVSVVVPKVTWDLFMIAPSVL